MAQEYPPSREEWQEWQAHPVTKWFRWAVGEVITDCRKAIGDGHTLRANSDDTAQETARQVGFVTGLQAALDAEPEVVEAASLRPNILPDRDPDSSMRMYWNVR